MPSQDERRCHPGPCAGIVAAVFGFLFLIALLSVPVTTTSFTDRADPGSRIVVRTTYPRRSRMFLPRYLAMKASPPAGTGIRLRSVQWSATLAVIAVLGIFDYAVFCRLLRRRRRQEGEPGRDDAGAASRQDPPPSGISLFP